MNRKHFFAAVILLSLLVMGLQLAFAEGEKLVGIDVKPGSYPNSFNRDGHGVIPVAILGSSDLDVLKIRTDLPLYFAGLVVRVKGNDSPQCSIEDVNGDGYDDLVCQFVDDPANWTGGDDIAYLYGVLELDGGTLIEIMGSDEITIVP